MPWSYQTFLEPEDKPEANEDRKSKNWAALKHDSHTAAGANAVTKEDHEAAILSLSSGITMLVGTIATMQAQLNALTVTVNAHTSNDSYHCPCSHSHD